MPSGRSPRTFHREHTTKINRRHRYIDFPLDYPLFLCERHHRMTANPCFQDNLLHHLLCRDTPD